MSDGLRLYLTNDLLFSSQILSASQSAQRPLEWVSSQADLPVRLQAGNVKLVILDLGTVAGSLGELLTAIRSAHPECNVIAYGPHVQVDRLIEAQQSGCNEVLARGAFSREISRILHQFG